MNHVLNFIEGVGNLIIGQKTVKMVPINEMTQVLRVVKKNAELRPKQWVRIKTNMYRVRIYLYFNK